MSDQEFVNKMRQFQRLHWIESKQICNMRLSYAETNQFFWRGEVVFKERIELNQQIDDSVQYFRKERQTLQDGSIEEKFNFRDNTYILRHRIQHHKINENNCGIHKKYDDRILLEQLIFCKYGQGKTLLTVVFHLSVKSTKDFVKFLRECMINYCSLQSAHLYEKQSLLCELRIEDDQVSYVCNYNDTNEYQPQEQDAKYINDHYRITQLDSEDQEYYYQLYQRVSEYKLSSNTIIRWLIARGNGGDNTRLINCQLNYFLNSRFLNLLENHNVEDRLFIPSNLNYILIKCMLCDQDSNLERYKWYFIGFLEDVCRSCKGYVDSYITILDVDGFGFSNFDLQMTKSLLNMVLQYFPERQNKVFIINMSGFVMGFYKMLKPFLPTRTNDKVIEFLFKLIFIGKDRAEIDKTLMEHLGVVVNF